MRQFLEYTTPKGKQYLLRFEQIRALESLGEQTRIHATIGGNPITFIVSKDYKEISAEFKRLMEETSEVSV